MEFGISCSSVSGLDFAQHGESLGYTRCWVSDTPLIRSNLFATMAAVAMKTKTIKIGSGVAVCGIRLAVDCANGIATINALAPGRTFAVIGAGNTGMRMLGQRPMGARAMKDYVRVVQGLLRGEEVMYSATGPGGEEHPVRFAALEQNYVRLDPLPEVHVAGNGPLSQSVAGEISDGLCVSIPRGGTIVEAMGHVRRGAAKVGRTLPDSFHTAALVNLLMLEPGESLTSDRVLKEIGPSVMANFHYLADWVRETGKEPPAYIRPVWNQYMAFLQKQAGADAHMTLHSSHYVTLQPEEAQFLTPEIIRNFCIIGEPPDLVEQLRQLERDGLKQVTFIPPFAQRFEIMERFARQVMEKM